jgi:transcriptional regulator with XRE-family HTH domain
VSLTPESSLLNMKTSNTPGGNRLRTLREYYGRTQLDIELDASLGIGYLQRVEAGKVRQPERDTLERILMALGARYTERRDILELFGYVVDTPLPTPDEIQWATGVYQSEINPAVFPAYLLDCAHRLLSWNSVVPMLFGIYPAATRPTVVQGVSMLRIIFDPAYQVASWIVNSEDFFPAQIRALRYEMQWFRDEPWYKALIDEMLQCPLFERYWQAAESGPTYHVAGRPLVMFQLDLPGTGLLQFRLISEPFAQDRRFRVLYYLPAEPQTAQQCLRWLESSRVST